MLKSTRKRAVSKPHPDFPLFPHATGRWAKKVKGKFAYFGKVADDPNGQAALVLWLKQKDDLLAGRTPQTKPEGLDLRELLDRYVVAKRARVDSGEITPRTFNELFTCCKRIGDVLGLDRLVVNLVPDDFSKLRRAIAKIWGPTRLGNEVQRVRSVFKFGYESRLIDRPVLFGPEFKKPSAKTLRLNRAKNGERAFTAEQLRAIIDAAGVQMKAMILLGINCGFGNGDCAKLPLGAVDLKGGWITCARPKTGIERRIPLWPETVAALEVAIAERPKPKDKADASLMFITKYGGPWDKSAVTEVGKDGKLIIANHSPISQAFRKVLTALKLHRPGLGFYAIRHTFETVGGASKDQVSVNAIMGHVDSTMAGHYREYIDDERLVAVVNHVRGWLFG